MSSEYTQRVKRGGGGIGSKKERRLEAKALKRRQRKAAILIAVRADRALLLLLVVANLPRASSSDVLLSCCCCCCQTLFRGYVVRMFAWAVRYLLSPTNIRRTFNRVVADCGVDGGLDRIGLVKLLRMLGVSTGFDKTNKDAWNVRARNAARGLPQPCCC